MKKTKILLLTLVLTLVIGAAVCVAASAADSKTPDIISQNVRYDEVFSLMYAVDASSVNQAPVTLNLYYDDPAEGAEIKRSYTASEPQVEKIDGKETLVYVFTTEGVAAKYLDKNFYVQAVDKSGAVSETVRYSVLEYLLVRLYGGQTITEGQKALYEDVISFASSAQKVLINERDADTTNDVPLANTYSLVTIEDGVILEKANATKGYSQGVYPAGAKIYPYRAGFDGKWKVTTASGSTEVANGAEITVNGYTSISEASTVAPGGYFENYGGVNFNDYTYIRNAEIAGFVTRPTYFVKNPNNPPHTGTEDYIGLYTDGDDKYMGLTTQEATNKPGVYLMDTEGAEGNCYVFETEFKINMDETTAATIAANSDARLVYFSVATATNNKDSASGTDAGVSGSGLAAIYAVADAEGKLHYYLNHNNSKAANNDIITKNNEITAGWHTMTVEIYENVDRLTRVRDRFYGVFEALAETDRICVVNAARPIEEIHDDIVRLVNDVLN
jgi:hypothetical protein